MADVNDAPGTHSSAAQRLFRNSHLSVGLNLPLTAPGQRDVDMAEQLAHARLAERHGFDALWIRDVPLNSPGYPDPIRHPNPWVFRAAGPSNLSGGLQKPRIVSDTQTPRFALPRVIT